MNETDSHHNLVTFSLILDENKDNFFIYERIFRDVNDDYVLMDEFNKTASNYVLPNRPPKKGYSVALSMHFYNKDDKQHIAELEKQYMEKYHVKTVLVKNELTNQLTTVEL